MISLLGSIVIAIVSGWVTYIMIRPKLMPLLNDVKYDVHFYTDDNFKIISEINVGFHNINKLSAIIDKAWIEYVDNNGGLCLKTDLKHTFRNISTIGGGETKTGLYKPIVFTTDINFHLKRISLEIKYTDTFGMKYYSKKIFSSSNGTIWYGEEWEHFRIGLVRWKPLLKLKDDEDGDIRNIFDWCAQYIRKIGIKIMENRKV